MHYRIPINFSPGYSYTLKISFIMRRNREWVRGREREEEGETEREVGWTEKEGERESL